MRRVIVCISIFALLFFGGCNPDSERTNNEVESSIPSEQASLAPSVTEIHDDYFRVGLSLQDNSPFVLRVGSKLEKLIESGNEDIELVTYNGMANANAQIAHVESFVSSGFNAIIINPISYKDCAMAVTIAKNAAVPLITTIADTYNPTGYLSFIGSDHYESGVIEAKMAAEYLGGTGKVAILEGVMGISAQTDRYKGYMDVLKEYPGIDVVAVQTAAWQRDEAYAIVENWIRNDKDFSVILSENDNMAMGAIEAIEELGKQDEIAVFGIDGDMDALLAVKEGRLEGTVFHNAQKIAQTLYDCVLKLKIYGTIEPDYLIPFEPVTIENVEKYISEY